MTRVIAIRVLRESPNDETMKVIAFGAVPGSRVSAGEVVCEIEGSKAVVEIPAPADGLFYPMAEVGQHLPIGALLGAISPVAVESPESLGASLAREGNHDDTPDAEPPRTDGVRFSRDALRLIEELGLSREAFVGRGLVTDVAVQEMAAGASAPARDERRPKAPAILPAKGGTWRPELETPENGRTVVVGASSGAYQLLSVLLTDPSTEVVGLVDDDPEKFGADVFGVRVLGAISELRELATAGRVDSIVLSTSRRPEFRRRIMALAEELGLMLGNVIHPSAVFDGGVRVAGGCYLGPKCYFGAETRIGALCYLSSGTTFEHHNEVGIGVTTGPNVATSGVVRIGNWVRFGTGVVVEPQVRIGDEAAIASGSVLTRDVPPGETVRSRLRLGFTADKVRCE